MSRYTRGRWLLGRLRNCSAALVQECGARDTEEVRAVDLRIIVSKRMCMRTTRICGSSVSQRPDFQKLEAVIGDAKGSRPG